MTAVRIVHYGRIHRTTSFIQKISRVKNIYGTEMNHIIHNMRKHFRYAVTV